MTIRPAFLIVVAAAGSTACSEATPRTAADSQAAHIRDVVAAGGVVDSILPIEEQLRRFRAELGPRRDTLRQASPSVDALAARWAAAVAARDSAALGAMVIDRAEFAWLYYPDSRLSRPPWEAPPQLLWGQLLATSEEGATAALRRLGGHALRVLRVGCPTPEVEGDHLLHGPCQVALEVDGIRQPEQRLFGTILEHAGRFKFVGLGNAL